MIQQILESIFIALCFYGAFALPARFLIKESHNEKISRRKYRL